MGRENYEVYYFQNGRWQLHASHPSGQREQAIEDAKGVEAKEGYPSRVVRETFSDETNTSSAAITWQSPTAKSMGDSDSMFGEKKPTKAPAKKRTPGPQRPAAEQARPEPVTSKPPPRVAGKAQPRKQKVKKRRSGFVRLLLAILISLAIAIISLITTSLLVAQMMSMGKLAPANYTQLIIGASVLVFFVALFMNLQSQFKILSFLRGGGPKQSTELGRAQMLEAARKQPKHVQDMEFDQVEVQDVRDQFAPEDAASDVGDAPAELEAGFQGPDSGAEAAGFAEDAFGAEGTPVQPEAEPQPEAVTQPEAAAPLPQPNAANKKPAAVKAPERAAEKSPAEADARASLEKFIGDALRAAKPEPTNVFSKFGMNLYFAGGASVIGQSKRLPKDLQLSVLKDALISAGNSPDRAETFCVELPSYGKNPRYTFMVQAGAKAMTSQMSGNASATAEIGSLLSEWNLPEKRPTVPSVFTFVFTDIVGSTAMTQRLGNAGAQKAVRAHNTAVRGAIQAYKGREVKHTGDGIMAVFPDPAAAVQATIRMQREIAAHNSANPDIEVVIRIGVNVGEAVEEDNDFFGAAVQMTARICDKASKGNIWVSQAVMSACKGQKIGFIPRGQFEMKGIQGPKPLFEIGWSDAHKNELADL